PESAKTRIFAHVQGHVIGSPERGGVGNSLAGDIEGGAVVDARADERQPHRNVYAIFNSKVFDRNQSLVVVLGNHNVELPAACPPEEGVAWPGAADVQPGFAGQVDSRFDDFDFFRAETSVFAGVRVQSCHRDTGLGDTSLQTGSLGQPDGLELTLDRDVIEYIPQGQMYGHQNDAQLWIGKHHGVRRGARALSQDLGMARKIHTPQLHGLLVERCRHDRPYVSGDGVVDGLIQI